MIHRLAVPILATFLLTGCFALPTLKPATSRDTQRLDRAVAVNPENVHALFERGRAHLEASQPRQAERLFRRVVELQPSFEEAWYGIGVALMDQEKFAAAERHFSDMSNRLAESVTAQEGLAVARLALRKVDAAEAAANEALRIDAESAEAYRILGEVAYIRGDYRDAIANWRRASDLGGNTRANALLNDLEDYLEKYAD